MDLNEIVCEIRYAEDVTRESPGRLTGTLLTYERPANDRPEIFTRGALEWPENGIVIDEQHNRQAPIVRAIPRLEGDALTVDVPLPNTSRGRDAAVNVREGVLTGLSVSFLAIREGKRGPLREIRQARLLRAGLVDTPSYLESMVEVRSQGGLILPRLETLWL